MQIGDHPRSFEALCRGAGPISSPRLLVVRLHLPLRDPPGVLLVGYERDVRPAVPHLSFMVRPPQPFVESGVSRRLGVRSLAA